MFDIIRAAQSIEATAKLGNVIGQLFAFRDTFRPSDLIALLDDIESRIVHTHNHTIIEREPTRESHY